MTDQINDNHNYYYFFLLFVINLQTKLQHNNYKIENKKCINYKFITL